MGDALTSRRARWPWLFAGIGLLASAAVLYGVEWVEVTTDQGPTLEALRNPYFAADRYLSRLGVTMERESRLHDVATGLAGDDALVMTTSRATLTEAAVTELLDWVAAGGHLVALALHEFDPAVGGSHDPLLDRLGVRLERTSDAEATELDETVADLVGTAVGPATLCRMGPQAADVNLDGTSLRVQFTRNLALTTDGNAVGAAANGAGAQLLQVERGAGLITVLTTTAMWRNSRIGCHDHAHLLGVLLGDSDTVYWLAGVEMPALYALLWKHFPYAVIGALLALLLWAWHRAFRLLPPRAATAPPRRSLLEHLRAAAAFHWRHDHGDVLLEILRAEVLTRAGGHPQTPRLAAAAQRAGLSAEAVERALSHHRPAGRDDFLACVQVLQRLRRVI